jgi:signal transduction histidine kinase
MYDFQENDSVTTIDSQINSRIMANRIDKIRDTLMNCPAILTGMSHEMRTHMNSIVAFSFLLKDKSGDTAEKEEYSNHILNSCEQLIDLFDSFLDSAIIEAGDTEVELKRVNLNNILDDLIPEFRETLKKDIHKDLELVTEIQFTDSTDVLIDKHRIARIVRSLFFNSIKTTKSGYIKIGYYYNDSKLTFYVLDSGQGYDKFSEFLQTREIDKLVNDQDDTSTIINLSLARKLIQLLGGTLRVECNGLTGTGVYFSIPARVGAISKQTENIYNNSMIAI